METKKPDVILIHHPRKGRWLREAANWGMLVGFIGLGVVLDSAAMQWTGALLAMLAVIGFVSPRTHRLTIAEARAFLDRIEAAEGRPDA